MGINGPRADIGVQRLQPEQVTWPAGEVLEGRVEVGAVGFQPIPLVSFLRSSQVVGGRDRVEDLRGVDVPGQSDLLGGGQVETAREGRNAGQDAPFGFAEQVIGPVDKGAEGLVTGERGPGSAGEQEAVIETALDISDRQ